MKKVIGILLIVLLAFTANVSAQTAPSGGGTSGGDKPMESMSLNFVKIDGPNTVPLPNGIGALEFFARGDRFSDGVFTDARGKTTRLVPRADATASLPQPPCQYPIPDACFGSPNKKIGLCICRPTDISAGGGDPNAILIGLLLPAVQKIREPAAN